MKINNCQRLIENESTWLNDSRTFNYGQSENGSRCPHRVHFVNIKWWGVYLRNWRILYGNGIVAAKSEALPLFLLCIGSVYNGSRVGDTNYIAGWTLSWNAIVLLSQAIISCVYERPGMMRVSNHQLSPVNHSGNTSVISATRAMLSVIIVPLWPGFIAYYAGCASVLLHCYVTDVSRCRHARREFCIIDNFSEINVWEKEKVVDKLLCWSHQFIHYVS